MNGAMERTRHPSTPELRRQWRRYWTQPRENWQPMPPELADMTCGAKTRAGTPCKRRDLFLSGRCALHGGLSTGPKKRETAEETLP